MPGTQTAGEVLGFDDFELQVHGSSTDAVKVNAANPRSDTVDVSRVTSEYVDQAAPHPMIGDPTAADSANADGEDADYARTLSSEVDHDGYGGRGGGKKDVDGTWDAGRDPDTGLPA